MQLTIDWNHAVVRRLEIDEFEAKRGPRKQPIDLLLGWVDRQRILKRAGAKDVDIFKCVERAQKVQRQRQQTASRLKYRKVEELLQSLRRSVAKTFQSKPVAKLKTKY